MEGIGLNLFTVMTNANAPIFIRVGKRMRAPAAREVGKSKT